MNKPYFYRIYGYTVQSDILLPGAMPCEQAAPDITANLGEIPAFLRGSRKAGYGTWTNHFENAWFFTPGAGEFYIEKGVRVIIAPLEAPNWDLLASLFLSAAMSLVLLQRNQAMFHGSALEYRGRAFIVSGDSGAGKSTVSFELLKHPYGFLADDTVRVHQKDGIFVAEPSYPQQKVCRDMALRMGLALEQLRYIDENRDKFAKMCTDRYVSSALPLQSFLILRKDPSAETVYSKQLTGREYLDAMIHAFYLADTYRSITGFPSQLMQELVALSSQIQVYAVYRPAQGNTVKAVTQEVERLIQNAQSPSL